MKNTNQILDKKRILNLVLCFLLISFNSYSQIEWPCEEDLHGFGYFHMDCPNDNIIITSLEEDGFEGSEIKGIITSGQTVYILPGYSQVRILPDSFNQNGIVNHTTTIGNSTNIGGFTQPSSQTRVELYPNPTQSDISITVDGKQKIISYTLLDMYETSINEEHFMVPRSNHTLSIETLKKGIYILKIYLDNKEVITKKIIKN